MDKYDRQNRGKQENSGSYEKTGNTVFHLIYNSSKICHKLICDKDLISALGCGICGCRCLVMDKKLSAPSLIILTTRQLNTISISI